MFLFRLPECSSLPIVDHTNNNNCSCLDFQSVPASLWWAIQTITTVGYGDMIPTTFTGKFLSALLMAFGALTISLPVLSIVTKFSDLYVKNINSERFNADCVM